MQFTRLVAVLGLAGLATACANSTEFPSLAKRSYETRQASAAPAPPPAPPPAPVASDPVLLDRIAKALDQARGGQAAFAGDLKAATSATAAAGSAGKSSDAWINAQLQISRAERALAPAVEALAVLDRDLTALVVNRPTSPDRAALEAAVAEIGEIANGQRAALLRLADSLKR